MTKLKVKVCGMKVPSNIEEIAALGVDYMGFIFSKESKRFVGKDFDPVHLNLLHPPTQATGIFINEYLPNLLDKVDFYHFDAVQLHGDETAEYCRKLRNALPDLEIIKAFSVDSEFDFAALQPYTDSVTYFLFDKKGDARGGNGEHFDWKILERYTLTTPYFLSGGISLEDAEAIRSASEGSSLLVGIDLNSRFEKEMAVKDVSRVSQFIEKISNK